MRQGRKKERERERERESWRREGAKWALSLSLSLSLLSLSPSPPSLSRVCARAWVMWCGMVVVVRCARARVCVCVCVCVCVSTCIILIRCQIFRRSTSTPHFEGCDLAALKTVKLRSLVLAFYIRQQAGLHEGQYAYAETWPSRRLRADKRVQAIHVRARNACP